MEDLSNRSLRITRILDAPVEQVWIAWTRPEHIRVWWGPDGFTNTILKMEVEVGGEWEFIMHGPDGTDYKNKHIYRELIPHRKIVMDHVTGPKFTTIVEFFPEGGRTRMEWLGVFEKAADLQQAIKVFRADEGLAQNIERFATYLRNLA